MFDVHGRPLAKVGPLEEDLEGHTVKLLSENMVFESIFLRQLLESLINKYHTFLNLFIGYLFRSPIFIEDRKLIIEQGVKEYGAYWCPNCQSQKKLFGKSFAHINYIECASGNGQSATCQKAKIEAYPTWEFKDGSREIGAQTLEALSEKTGCPLEKDEQPVQSSTPTPEALPSSAPEESPSQ